jgi:electron transport complex protein RnfC
MSGDLPVMIHPAGAYLHGFHGGLKLRHYKQISTARALARPPLPEYLQLSLQQHAGSPAIAVVEPGQHVAKGELLARAGNGLSAPVHAPTSGTIAEIQTLPLLRKPARSAPSIRLHPDGEERWHPDCERSIGNWRDFTPAQTMQRIAASGIVGLGGAVFPTASKLSSQWHTPAHTLIINGAECEPYISCDEMLMREHASEVMLGARIVAHALGITEIVIAIEDQLGALASALETARSQLNDEHILVVRVPAVYPEGGERQLIKMLTGLEVPSDGYPQTLGLACINVATAWAVKRALLDREPLIERVITVTGAIAEPRNWLCLLGTPIQHLLQCSGGLTDPGARLVIGGPVMGEQVTDPALGIDKGSNCLLALAAEQLREPQQSMPCINCGECVRVCPAMLMPQLLYHGIRKGDHALSNRLQLTDCIECGCCDLVCPSQIPLTDYFRAGKQLQAQQRQQQARADKSALRHAAHEQRLQDEAAQAARKEAERQARASNPDQAQAVIGAALQRARLRKQAQKHNRNDTDGDTS